MCQSGGESSKLSGTGKQYDFLSATLLPVHYYKKLLSVEKDDYAVYAHSSFPQENKFLFIGTDVSTRYTRRGESTYQRFARYIAVMAEQKKGNYMAFFSIVPFFGRGTYVLFGVC